jgi:hypothetical protein
MGKEGPPRAAREEERAEKAPRPIGSGALEGSPAAAASTSAARPVSRSSSLLVAAPDDEEDRARHGACAAAVAQLKLSAVALGLALTVIPVAVFVYVVYTHSLSVLPNVKPGPPCRGLPTARWGVDIIVLANIGPYLLLNGVSVAAIQANPRAARLLSHSFGVAMIWVGVSCFFYPSVVPSPDFVTIALAASLAIFLVFMVPFCSAAAWGFATAKRRRCKRFALEIIHGFGAAVISTSFGVAAAFYVTLSDNVGGVSGVVINGKATRNDPASTRALTLCPKVCSIR